MKKTIDLLLIGAGDRGGNYIRIAEKYPDQIRIAGIAEPRDFYLHSLGDKYNVPMERRFSSWEEAAAMERFADAVIIATPDHLHEEPAIAFAQKKYHILLEKPIAPTEEACRRIIAEVKKSGCIFAVCHELRYTYFSQTLKKLLEEKAIGDLVSVQHLEPVGYWHQAHSFVRGNWRNEAESSFMLLAKCCHDLDWLRYMVADNCKSIQSFGSLRYFHAGNRPAGAADRCCNCPEEVEKKCPYSALKIYLRGRACQGEFQWPVRVVSGVEAVEAVSEALKDGPYGRCAYACDNDVVDNQTVNMVFANGCTVSMTMTAFVPIGERKTRLFGTRGFIETDSKVINIYDFLTDQTRSIDVETLVEDGILASHGGADLAMMEAFVQALFNEDTSYILSGADESLESHLMVFAAERSRRKNTVEAIF